jgi:hypothetical protein
MSDELKKRSRAWIGWTAVAVFVLYPLSVFPACLVGEWSVELGIFRSETVAKGIDTLYAPFYLVTDRVPALEAAAAAVNDTLLPLYPHGRTNP